MIKYTELLCETFGSGKNQKHGYPGHPEIELALLRLYHKTQNLRHLELAKFFINERGNPTGQDGQHYYTVEAKLRGDSDHTRPDYYPEVKAYWLVSMLIPLERIILNFILGINKHINRLSSK